MSGNEDIDAWFQDAFAISHMLDKPNRKLAKNKLFQEVEPTEDEKVVIVGKEIFGLEPSATINDIMGKDIGF
jgi:hypothetical protein